jgi:hypothetical protein
MKSGSRCRDVVKEINPAVPIWDEVSGLNHLELG